MIEFGWKSWLGLVGKVGWVWLEKLVGFGWKSWLRLTAIMFGFG